MAMSALLSGCTGDSLCCLRYNQAFNDMTANICGLLDVIAGQCSTCWLLEQER